jgi:hypothetical protein
MIASVAFRAPLDAAAHRAVEEVRSAGGEPPRGLARGVGRDGGAIDDDRALAECGSDRVDDREEVGVGGHAGDDDVAGNRELSR